MVRNRDFLIAHLQSMPQFEGGGPCWNIAIMFGEKSRMVDILDCEKFENIFTHFDRKHKRDR